MISTYRKGAALQGLNPIANFMGNIELKDMPENYLEEGL